MKTSHNSSLLFAAALLFAATNNNNNNNNVVSGVSWPKWRSSSSDEEKNSRKLAEQHVATVVNNNSIENIIHKEKRYVLYNSRRLTGECLPICYDPSPSPVNTVAPVDPTVAPVDPTVAPVDPTVAPVDPTVAPVDPTVAPVDPTVAPVDPTDAPVDPTVAPVSPTNNPTPRPTDKIEGSYECRKLPDYLRDYTAIVKGNFLTAANSRYKIAVEGLYDNPSDDDNVEVVSNGRIYYGELGHGNLNYNGGHTRINSLSDAHGEPDFTYFQWLAQNLEDSEDNNGNIVKVFTSGNAGSGPNGCYTNQDVAPMVMNPEGRKTLAVFNTADDICLEAVEGFEWEPFFGPSVLAPFSKVKLTNARLDGVLIARSFHCGDPTVSLAGGSAAYAGSLDCGQTPSPTDSPTVGEEPVDPANFCHNLAVKHGCNTSPGSSCQIDPGPNNEPSCGEGVPEGYYPDLTNCMGYCKCTGTAAPSRYEVVGHNLYYDHKEASAAYLPGIWGKDGGNGAHGTHGGIPTGQDGRMSWEGTLRPPGTCGPGWECDGPNDNKTHPYDACKSFFQCINGSPQQLQHCGAGTKYDGSICNHEWAVTCQVPPA